MDEFSNRDRDVFLINCAKMIDRGALMSRYSRTRELDIRNLWDKEFAIDRERGEKFYERVFLDYGDESVAELVTAQVGIQNVSNVLSKIIEEGRIGLSYLEKSSRYVPYRDKKDGKYLYLSPEKAGIPERFWREYDEFNEMIFNLYGKIFTAVQSRLREIYPLENTSFSIQGKGNVMYADADAPEDALKKAYESAIRSRALDETRFILPASTLTNIGISGNARAFSHLLERLKANGSREAEYLYGALLGELRIVFPRLIENVESAHGRENIDYMRNVRTLIPVVPGTSHDRNGPAVSLISSGSEEDALNSVISSHIFEGTQGYYQDIYQSVSKLDTMGKRDIISRISSLRHNRRNKLSRSFEHVHYTFEINTNFGAFRDMQRHRALTLQRKALSTDFGYDAPPIISGMEEIKREFDDAARESARLYSAIKERDPISAQYVVLFAHRYPSLITVNLRELVYFVELRSTPQAHFDLRRISREMAGLVMNKHPGFSPLFKFLNTEEEGLGRLNAELRKEMKQRSL